MRIHNLLRHAVDVKASDIHLAAGEPPALRINGEVERIENADSLSATEVRRIAYSIMNEKQKVFFENNLELDFSFGVQDLARFRVNVFQQRRGIGLVLRQIPSTVLSLEDINAPNVFRRIAETRKGLVLVTGPTGSGKSTTLAAIIDFINKNRAEHIITIEDPLEFIHKPHRCIINQREVGTHTKSFGNALRSALREDPDVILVGEMRDLETVSLAMSAAETGHLVFGTLHTNSCPETIDRIIDSYPHEQQSQIRTMLSTSLMAVITQGLLRTIDGTGRVAIHEIMLVNRAIRNLIRENKLHQIPSTMETSKGSGMQTMEMALKAAVAKRQISRQQAIAFSNNPNLFKNDAAHKRPGPSGRRR